MYLRTNWENGQNLLAWLESVRPEQAKGFLAARAFMTLLDRLIVGDAGLADSIDPEIEAWLNEHRALIVEILKRGNSIGASANIEPDGTIELRVSIDEFASEEFQGYWCGLINVSFRQDGSVAKKVTFTSR